MVRVGLAWRKVFKLTAVAAVPAVTFVAAWLALQQVSRLAYLRASIAFLVALEVGYGVALAVCLVGVPTLFVLLLRARPRRVGSPRVAYGLLACVSVLIGLGLCELTAAALLARSHRRTAVPVGGFKTDNSCKAARPGGRGPAPDRLS